MLDGLLGRNGFTSKSKSLIKPTRTRIAALRRREEAKQRFLKEDLAKLLANGLDVNAYGRTEEFIAGLNILSCYTFIDQSCEYILKQLSMMQKLGQCPEECRETVASLMFAAARFSDLPELRDLRDLFQERYGNGFECYVNQVFVEKLASKPPAVEKRIKLLQDIAAELLIQWDSKGFKQRMDKSSALGPKLGSLIVTDDECKPPIGNNGFRKNDQHFKERAEHAHQVPPLRNDKIVNIRRKEVLDIPNVEKKKHGYKHDKLAAKAENGGYSSKGTPESNINKSIFGENGKMPESTYNSSLPPPYVKLNIPPPYSKPHNASNMEKMKKESDHEIEDLHYQNNMIPLPKPKSVRRRHRHSKSSSSHDDIGSSEDAHIVKRVSSSRRKERKGLQILFDDEQYPSHRDEEEKMMDKLLLHYSKKPSVYDVGKLRKKKTRSNSNDEEIVVPPTRSISLPHEESGESEPKKVYVRANSFQPDNQAKHVHPKLPDYDDLAARFAAMRGR
ncbi:hypothetical protein E3N88_17684 [Mikania micrantha]|uniref:Uncharacterized protein n=1 Tax=Mikania micrantha TaxID=192012 RepID=A0A5N6NV98_9ASTR|nr:hypothetical protein E3N88_17684 [Mikania micrantha]